MIAVSISGRKNITILTFRLINCGSMWKSSNSNSPVYLHTLSDISHPMCSVYMWYTVLVLNKHDTYIVILMHRVLHESTRTKMMDEKAWHENFMHVKEIENEIVMHESSMSRFFHACPSRLLVDQMMIAHVSQRLRLTPSAMLTSR